MGFRPATMSNGATLIIDDNGDIWLRQSWLDTATTCPERGRLAMVKPEWDEITSDSALCGTAAHYAIEQVVRKQPTDMIGEYAHTFVMNYADPVKFTAYHSLAEVAEAAASCAEAWRDELMHKFPIDGAKSEVTFKLPWFRHSSGRNVGITGTVDLVPNIPLLVDWKTSGRPYKQWEKQRFAVQPTIYALAAVKGGLQSDVVFEWPVRFQYGIMLRAGARKPATTQIVEVFRTEAHVQWVKHRANQMIDMAFSFGTDKHWPMVDDKNFLCSKKWCPWWSCCRGAFILPHDDDIAD